MKQIFTFTILSLLFIFINLPVYSQYDDNSGEIAITAIQSVKESVEKTEEAINKAEEGLEEVKKVLNKLKQSGKISEKDFLRYRQLIAESEYALDTSKTPLKQYNKYSGKVLKASELYNEINQIRNQYNKDLNSQGSTAASLRILAQAMQNYGEKVPVLGYAIEIYGETTQKLLDATYQASMTIDKNRNQGAISGSGVYRAGASREKQEIFSRQFPQHARNIMYIPTTPDYVYRAQAGLNDIFIWDEENKSFYKVPGTAPVETLYKLKLLTGRRATPFEMKILSEKWETVGKPLAKSAHKIATLFEILNEEDRYSPLRAALYEVRSKNYDYLADALNDPELFRALYLLDNGFRNRVNNSLVEVYTILAKNPDRKLDAETIYKLARESGISIQRIEPVSPPKTPPQDNKPKNNTYTNTYSKPTSTPKPYNNTPKNYGKKLRPNECDGFPLQSGDMCVIYND